MDLGNILTNIINPSSLVYGAISLAASIGTIIALAYTVHSVNESKKQTRLLSKKYTFDSMFESLEVILEKVVFYRMTVAGAEVYFGKLAFYRGMNSEFQTLFGKELNYGHIEEYVAQLTVNISVMYIMLSKLEDDRLMNAYEKKLRSEIRFCDDYVRKLLIMAKSEYKRNAQTYTHQLSKIEELVGDIDSMLEGAKKLGYINS